MNGTQSTGCFLQASQPATITPANSFQLLSPQSMFPGTSVQQGSASLSTTTLPVWSYAPPRTQTMSDGNNQEYVSVSPTVTATSSNPNPPFIFSAPKPVSSPENRASHHVLHALRRLTMRRKMIKNSPSTSAIGMFSFSPGPSITVPKQFSFNSTASTSNIFNNVNNLTLPDTKAFKFSSYPVEEKKITFNWSLPASSQAVNKNVFCLRGSFFDAIKKYPSGNFNSSGQSSSHLNNGQPVKFVPTLEKDIYLNTYGRFQSITAMSQYSSMSFEEIRFEYYKTQQRIFAFRPSIFSSNTHYFFTGGNQESKQVVHKEAQTSCDPGRQPIYPKRLFNDLWKILECAVCLDIVKTPIMQCQSGHHLCNQCWSKVTVCPMCKRKKTSVRNFALETVFETVPLPCKYCCEGCEEMVMAREKEKHEEACDFRPFICPIESCKQKIDPKNVISHIVSIHSIHTAVGCPLDNRSYVWNTHNVALTKYICAFNLLQWGMFLLCHKEVERTSCVWLQLLHVNSKDAAFIYEIKISNRKTMQSVVYRGPVTRLSFNAEEVKHKCLRISYGLLSSMRSTAYQMKLEIWKKNSVTT